MEKKCPVCDRSEINKRFISKGYEILTCQYCKLVFLSQPPKPEELDIIYNEDYFSHCKYQDQNTLSKENNRRKKLLTQFQHAVNTNILDVGCASGDFIDCIKDEYNCWGIDLSESAIKMAKEKYPKLNNRFKSETIFECRFNNHFFDGIVLWDVIEHLSNPLQYLQEVMKYLKPGGYLFFSTPDIGATTAKLFGKYWAFMTPPEHQVFFNRQSIKYLCESLSEVTILKSFTKGKWVNVGFILYKIKRIIPWLIPGFILKLFNIRFFRNWSIYVPTNDIRYQVIQKIEK